MTGFDRQCLELAELVVRPLDGRNKSRLRVTGFDFDELVAELAAELRRATEKWLVRLLARASVEPEPEMPLPL